VIETGKVAQSFPNIQDEPRFSRSRFTSARMPQLDCQGLELRRLAGHHRTGKRWKPFRSTMPRQDIDLSARRGRRFLSNRPRALIANDIKRRRETRAETAASRRFSASDCYPKLQLSSAPRKNMVGDSAPMRLVLRADSGKSPEADTTVLIRGESGNGAKRACSCPRIHYLSGRSRGPFL